MAKKDIYQIKVTLKHSKPPIWRRIQVPGDTRLDQLHLMLQAVMGWWDAHLHQFIVGGGTYYGEPHPDYEVWGSFITSLRPSILFWTAMAGSAGC